LVEGDGDVAGLGVFLEPDGFDGGDDEPAGAVDIEFSGEVGAEAVDLFEVAVKEFGDVAGGEVYADEGEDLPFEFGYVHTGKVAGRGGAVNPY
jgi:ethanolamine utilization microcompartment shell protein EutL